jgi:hypothetical protein
MKGLVKKATAFILFGSPIGFQLIAHFIRTQTVTKRNYPIGRLLQLVKNGWSGFGSGVFLTFFDFGNSFNCCVVGCFKGFRQIPLEAEWNMIIPGPGSTSKAQ